MVIVEGYNDPNFKVLSGVFYSHFIPDDWDYWVLASKKSIVMKHLKRLHPTACDYMVKKINVTPARFYYFGVSYHS